MRNKINKLIDLYFEAKWIKYFFIIFFITLIVYIGEKNAIFL